MLLITAAALGDRYGRRSFYAIGLGLFAGASALSALAPSIGWLIAARALQGAGAALVLTLGLALLSAAFPPERRGTAIGLFSAVTGIAVAIGPLVGGAIAEGIDWEWIFWLNVPIGLAAVPLVLTRIEESYGGDSGLDFAGLGWSRRRLRRRLGAGARELRRLGEPRGHRLAVGRAPGWRVRRLGAPRSGADAADAPFPLTRVLGRERGNLLAPRLAFGAVFFFAQLLQTGLGYGPFEAGLRLMPWTATFITVAPSPARWSTGSASGR